MEKVLGLVEEVEGRYRKVDGCEGSLYRRRKSFEGERRLGR